MAIYNCPKCKIKMFINDNDINSEKFKQEFSCLYCGAAYAEAQIENPTNAPSAETDKSATVGAAIKGVSGFVFGLCVIGSIVVMGESFVIGLAMLISSVLFSLLSYGIGEIICLLKDIKNKLK